MKAEFKKTQISELDEIVYLGNTIWRECYTEIITAAQIEYMLHRFQSLEAMTQQIKHQGYEYYLVSVSGNPIGYLGIQADTQNKRLFLSKIYLLQQYRGKGYASQSFEFLEQRAQKLDCDKIWLTVNRNNHQAILAYIRNGFIITGEQDTDIGQGFWMHDYLLEKKISP